MLSSAVSTAVAAPAGAAGIGDYVTVCGYLNKGNDLVNKFLKINQDPSPISQLQATAKASETHILAEADASRRRW
ncbi:hypothetical protein [Kutzneria buriramensis]|uniref:Uncharacterized protein n=1 Tax=Kutzneria buriramensis TaxID=1045776 RepID=A0A3E0HLF0_9PSEU|nr:hypothetical protein [Kutzneria buriramensis]REH46855.1 hypothetical protein BCF44_10619 [Kutzneria buriramensis]